LRKRKKLHSGAVDSYFLLQQHPNHGTGLRHGDNSGPAAIEFSGFPEFSTQTLLDDRHTTEIRLLGQFPLMDWSLPQGFFAERPIQPGGVEVLTAMISDHDFPMTISQGNHDFSPVSGMSFFRFRILFFPLELIN